MVVHVCSPGYSGGRDRILLELWSFEVTLGYTAKLHLIKKEEGKKNPP
jgi:hypothetical protein